MQHLALECAVRAALIAASTAIVLRILRVKMAAARHSAWAGVVILMMLLPVWTAWGPKASWRVLPAVAVPASSGRAMLPAEAFSVMTLPRLGAVPAPAPRPVFRWRSVLAGIYLVGVCVLLARLAIGTVRAHLLVRCAGHGPAPPVLTSSACAAPITVGWLTPTVILPECWRQWPQAQLDAVLAHEGEHARRRDPLVQWLALLNRAMFWFHPLAWWLERRLSALAEEACDAAVLARGCDPFEYAEYLLEMARSVLRTGARVRVLGMAMPGSSLPRRIRRILEGRPAQRISRMRMVCVAIGCAAASAVFTAGAVDRQKAEPRVAPPVVTAQALTASLPFDMPPSPPERRSLLAQVQAAPEAPAPQTTTPATPEDRYKDKRLLVLYFDLKAMPTLDRQRTFGAAQEFVRTHMQTHDLLAIMTANEEVKVMQDFTDDHDRLLWTLDRLMADSGPESGAAVDADRQLTQLHTAVNILGSLPGKKAVVYFSAPFERSDSAELKPLIDAAVRANVAFYSVDARGSIQNQPAGAQQQQVDEALQKLQELARRRQQLADQQNGQQATADQSWQQEMLRREAARLQEQLDQLHRGQQGQTSGDHKPYVIGSQDILQIWVIQQDGISGRYTIRPDGGISVPMIGNVHAAGLTVAQLEAVIADRLQANGILSDATVTVGVAELHRRQ